MNITYTGRHGELPPEQQNKLNAKFAKLAKLVDVRGADKGAHVVVTSERHLTNVEITVNFYDHGLVGIGAGPDFFTAMCTALEKLEKQALKVRTKWRDTKRGPKDKTLEGTAGPEIAFAGETTETAEAGQTEEPGVQVFRVNHHERRKPMTLEEAMIAIDGREYMVYRDADKDCVSVLIRRRDGNFDLVES